MYAKVTPAKAMTSKNQTTQDQLPEWVLAQNKKCMEDIKNHFDSATSKLTNEVTKNFEGLIQSVRKEVSSNSASIHQMRDELVQIDRGAKEAGRELEKKIDEQVTKLRKMITDREHTNYGSDEPIKKEAVDYQMSRRSLRLWPIKGTTDEELKQGAIHFIRNKLEVPQLECNDWQITRVRRIKYARKDNSNCEALVLFNDIYSRDRVSAHGKKLAAYHDQGKPTAGMKIDYPPHLARTFRTLEWYDGDMKKIHGEGLKRNIRYDDLLETFYMDIKLPGEDFWHRVDMEMATERKSHQTRIERKRAQSALEIPPNANMQPLGTRRTGSLTSEPTTSTQSHQPVFGNTRNVTNDPDAIIYVSPVKRT